MLLLAITIVLYLDTSWHSRVRTKLLCIVKSYKKTLAREENTGISYLSRAALALDHGCIFLRSVKINPEIDTVLNKYTSICDMQTISNRKCFFRESNDTKNIQNTSLFFKI